MVTGNGYQPLNNSGMGYTPNLGSAIQRPCPTPAYITCNPWASQAPYGSCGCNAQYGTCC